MNHCTFGDILLRPKLWILFQVNKAEHVGVDCTLFYNIQGLVVSGVSHYKYI